MRWKWIALIGAALIIAMAAAAYLVLSNYDYSKFKPQIARMVAEATGRELTLGGELSLDFGFSPALVITDVALTNTPWASDPQMITARRIEARVRLLPLLFGDVKLKYLTLTGVDVALEKNAAGQRNWEFTAPGGSIAGTGIANIRRIDVKDIRVENLKLTYRDEKTAHTARFILAGLEILREADPDFLTLKLQADYNGQPVELSGRIGRLQRILSGRQFPLELAGQFSSATIKIQGSIGEIRALRGIDLNVHVSGKNLEESGRGIGIQLPHTDAFDVSGHLTGSAQLPMLGDIHGTVSTGGAEWAVSGRIGNLSALHDIDLQLKASGRDLAQAGAIVRQNLPPTDEFTLQGRLTGSARALSLQDLRGRARRGSLSLDVAGTIKDLPALKGMDLRLSVAGKDLVQAETIVGQKLPPTDEFTLQGRLTGSARVLCLQDLRGRGRRGSLSLDLTGTIKDVQTLQDIDLRFNGAGKDLAQAGAIVRQNLPPTDEFTLQGRLTGSARALSLQNIRGRARRGSLSLDLTGAIKELLVFGGVDLTFNGAGKNLAQAGTIIAQKLPQTDAFALQGRLTGSARALSLQNIRGRARHGSLSLDVTGSIKDTLALEGLDLTLKAGGKELAEIGPLTGTTLPELGSFDLNGHLSGSAKSFSLADLTAVVDRSDFKGHAKIEFRRRPKITLVLESSLLDLTALLKTLEKEQKEPGSAPGALKRQLFRNDPLPFDVLKQVDADIRLNARNVRARDANFEFGRLALTLEESDLNVDTLQATYKQTRVSGTFHIYAESPPRVAAKFLVQDFDLGGLLREMRISDEVRSHLDIAVDVKGSGDSMHDLMAGLDGSVGAVMGEGYLTRYLDLLSVGLSRKVIQFWGHHEKGGEIRCAVVQFDISKGTATSRAFVFDTEAGVLTGEGDINLATEQVNFLLVPEPRYPSLMNFWTKLRVSGKLMDPKVRPDTLSLLTKGAKALGALLVGPLGLLAPFVNLGAYKAHPCNVESIGK
jgi:uncharacterized protein involved in outer membrane biogenesis